MGIPILKAKMGVARGLNQSVDENLLPLQYSPDCQNVDVSEGIISTAKGSTKLGAADPGTILRLLLFEAVGTGFYKIIGRQVSADPAVYKWFYFKTSTETWEEISLVDGGDSAVVRVSASTQACMCKIDSDDVLVVFDGTGDPIKIYKPSAFEEMEYELLGGTPPEGGLVTYHRERLWVAGVYGHYNTIYYSNAYDPEDWSTALETGTVDVETFDGDKIYALENIFDDVMIFKKNTIWRVQGDVPSEYYVEQIYSMEGTIYPNSICCDGNLCFFAGSDGIYQYDGIKTAPILTDEIKDLYAAMVQPYLLIQNNVLYVFDKGGTADKHIRYNAKLKTVEVIKIADVVDVAETEADPTPKIYYTDGNYVYYLDDTKLLFDATDIDMHWNTPESDFGHPNATKYLTGIYFQAWGTDSAGAAGGDIKMTISSNKKGVVKTKEKTVTMQATRKPYHLRTMIPGRSFKFKIENVDGSAINVTPPEFVFEIAED
jgi:hypothetical protein